tara:strand:+ start:284 stop:565 length:282 start_codon:yes stop_codon:yes gene_type:complete
MLEDIKDAENYIESCGVVDEIEKSFNSWLYNKDHKNMLKKYKDVNMSIFLYAFLRSVLSLGLGLYQGNIDKLKKMVDYIYSDITKKLGDHAES